MLLLAAENQIAEKVAFSYCLFAVCRSSLLLTLALTSAGMTDTAPLQLELVFGSWVEKTPVIVVEMV